MARLSCFVLAGFSLLMSGFPIYFSYSWAQIDDENMLESTDNTSKYKVDVCLSCHSLHACPNLGCGSMPVLHCGI